MFSTIKTAYKKDPALRRGISFFEVFLYQGVYAVISHRIAHFLWKLKIPVIPRLISQISRLLTGIEIHPGAIIGKRLFIDHGMGIVIGETAIIGDDVMMYHGVTLGGHGWWTDSKGAIRHPTIKDGTVLGVGCTVLGPITVGENSTIGAKALVIDDVPPNSLIVGNLGNYLIRNDKRINKSIEVDLPEPEYYL